MKDDSAPAACLTDPTSISWLVSRQSPVFGLQDDKVCQGLQWIEYGQSEILPYLQGYLYHCASATQQQRDVAFQQKQRAAKLTQALIVLDGFLRPRTFLVGQRLTLADTNLAVDLLPLFQVKLDGKLLIKVICSDKLDLVHLKRWHSTIINQEAFKKVFNASEFQLELASKKPNAKQPGKVQNGGQKLKVLCLHGYRQTSTTFYEKLGAFRKMVGKKCDMKFVNAPHLVPPNDDDNGAEQRGWWFSQPHGYFKSTDVSDCDKGFEESLQVIKTAIEEEGPFDGIMGFSQGAALVAIICMTPELASHFKFAMLFAPFKSVCSKHQHYFEKVSQLPALLVIGDGDQVVDPKRGLETVKLFENAQVVRHEGGHFVPATGKQKEAYLSFFDEQQ